MSSSRRRAGEGEPVIVKKTNSAFIGTDLGARLRGAGHGRLAIAGVITNNSVEATVRMAGNLGFDVLLVEDAGFTFAAGGIGMAAGARRTKFTPSRWLTCTGNIVPS